MWSNYKHLYLFIFFIINKIFSKDGKILSEAEKISKPTKKDSEKKELSK